MKPLAIELFAGLFGWGEGLIAEGYETVGFDIVDMHAEIGRPRDPRHQLVLQNVLTLHGRQFKDAALIVASPPCQEFSYMAMPWSRAKQIAKALRGDGDFPDGYTGSRTVADLTALFDACFRIQREAIDAAGHFIPMVVENVRGAIPWVGRSRWNYGSFHLYGDVPALMPMTQKAGRKLPGNNGPRLWSERETQRLCDAGRIEHTGFKTQGMNWSDQTIRGQDFTRIAGKQAEGRKNDGGSWFNIGSPGQKEVNRNPVHELAGQKTSGHMNKRDGHGHTRHLTNLAEHEGVKQPGISGVRDNGKGDAWFQDGAAKSGSKSNARKAASAQIAKIPLPLASWIAKCFKPA